MKVLLLAPTTLDLYIPILRQFENDNFEVYYIKDSILPFDYKEKGRNILKRFAYFLVSVLTFKYTRYWRKQFESNPKLNDKYDLFFCIQGTSFHKVVLDKIKKKNPQIRTSLYLWDSDKYYDLISNVKYFDKAYTFDFHDSEICEKLQYLPFYWTHSDVNKEIKYDISIVGSDHDGRFEIMESLLPTIKKHHLNYFIKIYLPQIPCQKGLLGAIFKRHYDRLYREASSRREHQLKTDLVITEAISPETVMDVVMQSRCIIDTDREYQTGTTPRVIWALASGKKIITTNTNIVNLPVYNSDQFRIIDRNNPVLDIDFIKSDTIFTPTNYINSLAIEKWIYNFI